MASTWCSFANILWYSAMMRLVLVGPLVYFKILRPSNPCTHGNGTLAYWGRGAYPLVGWFAEINGSLTDPCHTLTLLFEAKIAPLGAKISSILVNLKMSDSLMSYKSPHAMYSARHKP